MWQKEDRVLIRSSFLWTEGIAQPKPISQRNRAGVQNGAAGEREFALVYLSF